MNVRRSYAAKSSQRPASDALSRSTRTSRSETETTTWRWDAASLLFLNSDENRETREFASDDKNVDRKGNRFCSETVLEAVISGPLRDPNNTTLMKTIKL